MASKFRIVGSAESYHIENSMACECTVAVTERMIVKKASVITNFSYGALYR